jgi:hypothetical protein
MRRWLIAVVVFACKSSSPPTPPSNSTEPPPPPKAALLPPIDTMCANDGDCDHAWTYEIDAKCCDGTCSPKPAAKAWIAKVAEICERAGHADNCPTKKCAEPPPIACVDGQCRTR